MKKKQIGLILLGIFILVLASRFYFSFQQPYLTIDSYGYLRQAEKIRQSGLPLVKDELSYGGRLNLKAPLLPYLLAMGSFFMPLTLTAKILSNFMASLVIFVVFWLAKRITMNEEAAILAAFVSGFVPIFYAKTINTATSNALLIPLLFLTIYYYQRLEEKHIYLFYFLTAYFFLLLNSPAAIILVVGLLFYFLLSYIKNIKISSREKEAALIITLLTVWVLLIFYKKAFLELGLNIIWQGIPQELVKNYFREFTFIRAIYLLGFIPFIYGMYSIINQILIKKNKEAYVLIALALSTGIMLWTKTIRLNLGLMIFGITLSILFSQHYTTFRKYMAKTKLAQTKYFKIYFFISITTLFITTSILPSFWEAKKEITTSLGNEEMKAMKWLRMETDEGDKILAAPREGYLITALAKRKNLLDENFLLAPEADKRLADLKKIYQGSSTTPTVEIMEEYNIEYIYLSSRTKEYLGVEEFRLEKDEKCFPVVYQSGGIKIYESACQLVVIRKKLS